jgi:hypothetical protein
VGPVGPVGPVTAAVVIEVESGNVIPVLVIAVPIVISFEY